MTMTPQVLNFFVGNVNRDPSNLYEYALTHSYPNLINYIHKHAPYLMKSNPYEPKQQFSKFGIMKDSPEMMQVILNNYPEFSISQVNPRAIELAIVENKYNAVKFLLEHTLIPGNIMRYAKSPEMKKLLNSYLK